MTQELKSDFEKRLKEELTTLLAPYKNVKVLLNEVKVKKTKDNMAQGFIALDYITNAKGYALIMSAESPDFQKFIENINPPYKSHLLSEQTLAMTTSGERVKTFSPVTGGTVALPATPEGNEEACKWICEKITSIYLPRLFHLINLEPGLIQDIFDNPDHYSYPFLLILYTLRKNKLAINDVDKERLFSKKISKNNAFDRGIIGNIVDSPQ